MFFWFVFFWLGVGWKNFTLADPEWTRSENTIMPANNLLQFAMATFMFGIIAVCEFLFHRIQDYMSGTGSLVN